MPLYRAVVELYVRAADEDAADAVIVPIVADLMDLPSLELVINMSLDVEADDDPQCVCGVYRSEHALCGCGEWEARR